MKDWNDLIRERSARKSAGAENPYPNDRRGLDDGRRIPPRGISGGLAGCVDIAGRVVASAIFGKAAFVVIADRTGCRLLRKDKVRSTTFPGNRCRGHRVVRGDLFITRTGG